MPDQRENKGDEAAPKRISKLGESARFIKEEPAAERVLDIVMRLVSEVAVLRERLDTVEKLLAEKGTITSQDIEGYDPNEETSASRRAWQREYLKRLLR